MKFGFKQPSVVLGKEVLSDLRQRSMNNLNLWVIINRHVLIYFTICTNFHLTGFNSFLQIYTA